MKVLEPCVSHCLYAGIRNRHTCSGTRRPPHKQGARPFYFFWEDFFGWGGVLTFEVVIGYIIKITNQVKTNNMLVSLCSLFDMAIRHLSSQTILSTKKSSKNSPR